MINNKYIKILISISLFVLFITIKEISLVPQEEPEEIIEDSKFLLLDSLDYGSQEEVNGLQLESHRQIPSFFDVDEDGRLAVDDDGSLIVDQDLKYWFDFHFLMLTDTSLEAVVELMQSKIDKLPEPGNIEATSILLDYLEYRDRLMALKNESGAIIKRRYDESSSEIERVREAFIYRDQVRNLRREIFSYNVDQAFFAEDEKIEDIIISQSKLDREQLGSYFGSDISIEDELYQSIILEKDKFNIGYKDVE